MKCAQICVFPFNSVDFFRFFVHNSFISSRNTLVILGVFSWHACLPGLCSPDNIQERGYFFYFCLFFGFCKKISVWVCVFEFALMVGVLYLLKILNFVVYVTIMLKIVWKRWRDGWLYALMMHCQRYLRPRKKMKSQ